jgi:hypothetical protein
MDRKAVLEAMGAIRDCALAMMGNASYIQQELPRVEMTEELRSRTAEICESMVGTKHDVISELFEMDELLQAEADRAEADRTGAGPTDASSPQKETGQSAGSIGQAETAAAAVLSRIDRVIRWLGEDLSRLHELVLALREESRKNDDYTLALVLVQESAANIINAFNRAKAAAEALT